MWRFSSSIFTFTAQISRVEGQPVRPHQVRLLFFEYVTSSYYFTHHDSLVIGRGDELCIFFPFLSAHAPIKRWFWSCHCRDLCHSSCFLVSSTLSNHGAWTIRQFMKIIITGSCTCKLLQRSSAVASHPLDISWLTQKQTPGRLVKFRKCL